ncbi:DNA polymerase III subunit chi [Acidovorax sp. CCYZU-2555]|uniref:DNA polymerase III subunit chi n=1 Tax=Acidovorax sp. CCYZU-2555 TaxID=2835042 RepID=UPI001BCFDBAA|nr:DNA polymerase III subunit chi [Acidovorax sp. CCYZU-2555]MBS7779818.1 DNA polymerase III subunit chi [Acidovorax sp. CCYZU-2555]
MTEVAFHFNAPDKLAYVCRFVRKALRNDARVVVTGPPAVTQALSQMLWKLSPTDFPAHACEGDDAQVFAASPVVLVQDERCAPHQDLLLNLWDSVPAHFAPFARVVEVVSAHDEHDRAQARVRWKHYAGLGLNIVRHDLVLKGA